MFSITAVKKRKTPTSSSNGSNFVNRNEMVNDNSIGDTSNPEEIALREIAQLVAQRKNNENKMMVLFEAGELNDEDRILFVSRLNERFDKSKKQCISELREAGSSVEYQKVGSENQSSGVIDLTEDVKLEKRRNDINNNSNSSSSSSSNRTQSQATGRGNKASDINDDDDEDEEYVNHNNLYSKNSSTINSSSRIPYPSASYTKNLLNKELKKNVSSTNSISPRR